MIELLTFGLAFFLSYTGVELLRRWFLNKEILDIPNERSSHSTPTPRGGGLIIVIISLGFYALSTLFLPINFYWSYFVGALLISIISWLDDLFSISSIWRFIIHSISAMLVIWSLGFWNEFYFPYYGIVNFSFWGMLITFCWIVWLTNAFNFMDGIDGIAALQAVTAGIGWLIVGKILGIQDVAIYGGIIAFSSLGFLFHNWQPAKIFMGDVGSAFLGYSFAVIPLLSKDENNSHFLAFIGVILVFCFVVDSILTFIKRLFKKEKVWEPHRDHIYQKMVIKGFSHQLVALIYGSISIIIVTLLVYWLII